MISDSNVSALAPAEKLPCALCKKFPCIKPNCPELADWEERKYGGVPGGGMSFYSDGGIVAVSENGALFITPEGLRTYEPRPKPFSATNFHDVDDNRPRGEGGHTAGAGDK